MPKIVDHDQQRRTLLEGCFKIFSIRGYNNVTMRQLAEELGVSTGTLYHYFPTKVAILEQLFAWAVERDTTELEAEPAGLDTVDSLAGFWLDREENYRCLLLLALDLFRQLPAEAEQSLGQFAERYKESVSATLDTSYRVAHVVYTYLLGVLVHSLLAPTKISYDHEVEFVRKVLSELTRDGASEYDQLIGRLRIAGHR